MPSDSETEPESDVPSEGRYSQTSQTSQWDNPSNFPTTIDLDERGQIVQLLQDAVHQLIGIDTQKVETVSAGLILGDVSANTTTTGQQPT